MDKIIISQGKTTNEAIEKGLKELKVSKDKVEIKVLEEEKRSFYNILAPRVVKVELKVKEEQLEKREVNTRSVRKNNENREEIEEALINTKKFLDKFLKKEIKYTAEIKGYDIYVDIIGEDLNYLIGHRGDKINAFQAILTSIANKKSTAKIKTYLDIAGYREKRIKTLEELAEKIARTVLRTGKSVTLEPMTAYERKIIHSKLQSNAKVYTISKGEEPYRKVVVMLK
ncbi:MAG: RNA-binding cell elongation regulator Jag/EloR [Clostridia bacterium]|nr:RNA-binding cell elongation regulator Jag/EloR [Clostridia bacterium]